jgi:hypothetical protein
MQGWLAEDASLGRLIPPDSGIPNALIHSGSGEAFFDYASSGPDDMLGAMAAVLATLATSPADCVKVSLSYCRFRPGYNSWMYRHACK